MNKQEAIEEIKNLEGLTIVDKTINFDSKMIPREKVLNIVKQLDEPEKPVVPKFVADWYEDNKYTFEYSIVKLIEDSSNNAIEDDDLRLWFGFDLDNDKPIETLVNMHQLGYKLFEVI